MFEWLFNYPAAVFAKGRFVLLGAWPKWVLAAAILTGMVLLAWTMWRSGMLRARKRRLSRAIALWALQSATVVLLLLLLWEPAISVTSLKPQQNIVAVLVDNSRSMSVKDGGEAREQQAKELLERRLLPELRKHYQVRLYSLGQSINRVQSARELSASAPASRIGDGLRQLANEAGTLPIGSVVLLSDGSDTSGGVDLATMSELQRRRLPVNTIGFGRESLTKDVEMEAFEVSPKALEGARLDVLVRIRQNGFAGKRAELTISEGSKLLASRQLTLTDAPEQLEHIEFSAGKAGIRTVEARLEPLAEESNRENNRLRTVMQVDAAKRRILYVEGEPRWEYKFLRRAVEDDPVVEVVSMLRTTQNKIYRQGIKNQAELADGFPGKPEDLFEYQAIVLGSVEAGFFTMGQQLAIRDFVDRRGGGLLFLGGREALAEGGYDAQPLAQLLPVVLPRSKTTFQRQFVAAELTEEGKRSLLCRIEDDPEKSANHWDVLPYLADYQDAGTAKPGATVLARVNVSGRRLPLLVTENYGRGRTAVFATGGSWRWRMQQPVGDTSQETFWRQLLRWTVDGTPSRVALATSTRELQDDGRITLRAEVRGKTYLPSNDAQVQVTVNGPDGSTHQIALRPNASNNGIYEGEWEADRPGPYLAEATASLGGKELGRDVATFRREDGVAENFHQQQNRELLQRLAAETGGNYYSPRSAGRLPEEITFSEAGLTTHEMRDLWNMPVVFLLLLALRSAEWGLRRKWGFV